MSRIRRQQVFGLCWLLLATLCLTAASAHAAALDPASPWPEMRHDALNTGVSPIAARYHRDHPWAYRTGRGIFSTPVIGPDGTIYVGSADTYFYAIRADGRLRWHLKTGGIIDAGAALSAFDPSVGSDPLTFGSADDLLYHVTTPTRGRPRVLWRFRASVPPVKGQRVDWWEGPIAVGPDANLYAGNTGGTAYAVSPDGIKLWTFTAGGSIWTEPAFESGGASFWGSLDLNVYRLDSHGKAVWTTFTPGFVVSSPALGSDGTVYIGSFDSRLYALDPSSGTVKWTFETSDHIYASPALGRDSHGATNAVYIASTNGSIYKLSPSGKQIWRYDTGDPVRSSPVLGAAPSGRHGQILYVGSSNGKLYALNADTGRRRWSFDTTPAAPALRDRNDLNASPALGKTGVYIAGEDGYVDYVPYDYCLHRHDPRCSTNPSQELGNSLDRVFAVSAGGSTLPTTRLRDVSRATVLNLRLVVRRHGTTVNAAILDPDHVVGVRPRFSFSVQESGDGHFLYVVPRSLLRAHTTYRIHVAGAYTDNGVRMGNFDPHGAVAGHFKQTITLRTGAVGHLPLTAGRDQVSALTIRRLAVPMPAFLPSVNQIGFDSYDWIASTISRTHSHVLMWVIGAFKDARGVERVDPHSAFAFPLSGSYSGQALSLASSSVPLTFSFGPVPLRRFDMRGDLRPSLSFRPGASLYSEAVCADVPNYGPELLFTGICNPSGILAASGTFLSSAYRGSASTRPQGVKMGSVGLTGAPGAEVVGAQLRGPKLPDSRRHVAAILLTNAATGAPVLLDYRSLTSLATNAAHRITGINLQVPAGTRLPRRMRAYVIVDAFPLAARVLS